MSTPTAGRLLIVGNPDPVHVGAHFHRAAASMGLPVEISDVRRAYEGPVWKRRADWWIRGHRPSRLSEYSRDVVSAAAAGGTTMLLATGIAPVEPAALDALGRLGVWRACFLTDDPWNPAHAAPWFLEALPGYDLVFSPRRANLDDLIRAGVRRVEYLPFAFDPATHFPDPPRSDEEWSQYKADIMFAGNGDADRARIVGALAEAGLSVAVYGQYWDRFPETRSLAHHMLDQAELRRATASGKVALLLVRRANRDGNSMRTFEVPAMRACPLVEDTADHRELFGEERDLTCYFTDERDVVAQATALLGDPRRRRALADHAYTRITAGGHTYRDRLAAMLTFAERSAGANRAADSGTLSRI
ncbi:MAG TPA: glycosyltransferase [Vicinamibacterales bacterium]|nr:glycosyltransferase [Vicinamibacterales bacterium]